MCLSAASASDRAEKKLFLAFSLITCCLYLCAAASASPRAEKKAEKAAAKNAGSVSCIATYRMLYVSLSAAVSASPRAEKKAEKAAAKKAEKEKAAWESGGKKVRCVWNNILCCALKL
jgi:hypothetical protein